MRVKRTFAFIVTAYFVVTILSLQLTALAVDGDSVISFAGEQFDNVVLDELTESKIPNAAIAIIRGDEVESLSYPNKVSEPADDEYTLFQIGSLSKSFTGLGVLLLEDNGLLSLDDPVSKYLSWFTVSYGGKSVPPEAFTIANLLYQTSGFTNSEAKYPSASDGMSIEESVRQISGSDLEFYPSQRFAYANTNYRILGLIIEMVTGQSYDTFMTEHILLPLGLDSTYTDPQNAHSTGNVMEGSRLSFLRTWTYDIPVAEGNVPAGYIYSNTHDMSRWLQIHMGKIEVSDQLQRIIEKSHQPNPGSVTDSSTHYAAGWYVNDETGEIYHSGGNPNYSAYIEFRPRSNVAVCVLTNINASSNTNNIAANILNMLEGKSTATYQADVWLIFDMIFSAITVLGVAGAGLLIFIVARLVRQLGNGRRERVKLTRKRLLYFIPPSFLTIFTILAAVLLPIIFGSRWTDMLVWAPISLLTGMAAFAALSICAFSVSFALATFKKL